MSIVSDFVKHVVSGDENLAQATADALTEAGHWAGSGAQHVVSQLKGRGIEAALGALVGGGLMGPLGAVAGGFLGGRGGKKQGPRPRHPAFTNTNNYKCGYDKRTGEPLEGREPWSFVARVQLAAGAQAINTDLADFMAAASSSDTVTANQFGMDWDADEMQIFISGNIAASYVETLAVLAGLKLIERDYLSKEEAQFALLQLDPVYSVTGLVTSGAAATTGRFDQIGVTWEAHYTINVQYAFVLRTVRAFTSVGAIDVTMFLIGYR